jgi:Uroporphyrinogen decarboxylase (URO-D)
MNHRRRFLNTMSYKSVDRSPLYDFNYWDETIPQWHRQGMSDEVTRANAHTYLGLDASLDGGDMPYWYTGINNNLYPGFEPELIEDRGQTVITRDHTGVIVERGKHESLSIPTHVGHTLVDRASWIRHYKPKLDPDTPGRLPSDLDRRVPIWADNQRDHPVFNDVGSLYGKIRNWMGLENLAMVPYDEPVWFEEMVTTLADLQIGLLEKVFAAGAKIDACFFWEDMCYNAGPMLSPKHFKRYLVPQYRRITDLIRLHGCDVIGVDCDGLIDHLLPLWLEAGVNCMFPLEIGTWGADPVKYRKLYGQELLMMGGFNKRILATTPSQITDEIDRLAPLVEEGGYIAFCDHRVPPDVPLANYIHYCQEARRVWGKGVSLPPMPVEH